MAVCLSYAVLASPKHNTHAIVVGVLRKLVVEFLSLV